MEFRAGKGGAERLSEASGDHYIGERPNGCAEGSISMQVIVYRASHRRNGMQTRPGFVSLGDRRQSFHECFVLIASQSRRCAACLDGLHVSGISVGRAWARSPETSSARCQADAIAELVAWPTQSYHLCRPDTSASSSFYKCSIVR